MKKIIILLSVILLVANILFGTILTCYNGFNVVVGSMVVLFTTAMLYVVNSIITLKDAFKVSLSILFTLGGLVEFAISLFMPSRFSDNWGVIVIITLLALQGLIILLANIVSTKIR